jgi:cystathionine beta-synthase
MLREALRSGQVSPGDTVVEASSGNTGIGIAYFARLYHFKALIFVSKTCSQEKLDALKRLGAEVVVCENSNGMLDRLSTQHNASEYARKHSNSYYMNQYSNRANIQAHFDTTGPEIWQQSQQQITHFFAGIGTGGTISGVGQYLKSQSSDVRIIGVEPVGSVLSHYKETGRVPNQPIFMEKISGIGRTFVPNTFDPSVVDRILQVGEERTKCLAKEYQAQRRELLGFSSAAVICGFMDYVERFGLSSDSHTVLLFPDHGDRYLRLLYPEITDSKAVDYADI